MIKRIETGAFLVARRLYDSPVWVKPPFYLRAWLWILGAAAFAEHESRGHMVKRGELITTYDELIKACSYYENKRLIAPSLKQVRIIVAWLKDQGMITASPLLEKSISHIGAHTGAHTGACLGLEIIVSNYDTYQNLGNYLGIHPDTPKNVLGHVNNKGEVKEEKAAPSGGLFPKNLTELSEIDRTELKALAERTLKAYPKFQVWPFIQKCLSEGRHPGAIKQALARLAETPGIENPWPYAEQIVKIESGNFYEAEATARHQLLKIGDRSLELDLPAMPAEVSHD